MCCQPHFRPRICVINLNGLGGELYGSARGTGRRRGRLSDERTEDDTLQSRPVSATRSGWSAFRAPSCGLMEVVAFLSNTSRTHVNRLTSGSKMLSARTHKLGASAELWRRSTSCGTGSLKSTRNVCVCLRSIVLFDFLLVLFTWPRLPGKLGPSLPAAAAAAAEFEPVRSRLARAQLRHGANGPAARKIRPANFSAKQRATSDCERAVRSQRIKWPRRTANSNNKCPTGAGA